MGENVYVYDPARKAARLQPAPSTPTAFAYIAGPVSRQTPEKPLG